MNRICLFIAALILVMAAQSPLSAQRTREIALVGKINLKAVLLLHPAMASYDPAYQAFKVDASRVSPQVQQQKAAQHKAELEKLSSTLKSTQAKIHELRRNHDRNMQNLSNQYVSGIEKLATGPAGLKRQEYLINSNRTESAFNAKLQAMNNQLLMAQEQYDRLSKVAYHVGHTDPDETKRKFSAILNEVRQYTQQIATQKNVQVVLNTSLSSSLKLDNRNNNIVMPPELDYAKVFSIPFPREISGDEAAVAGYYGNITSLAFNWLTHGDKILDPFRASILDNDVFIGGVDLTPDVLVSIFRAYKIDTHIGNAIIQSLNVN